MNATLQRSDGASAYFCGVLIRKSRCSNEDQCFTSITRDLCECLPQFVEFKPNVLLRVNLYAFGELAIPIFDLATAFAILRPEFIAEYREQPCRQICARLE